MPSLFRDQLGRLFRWNETRIHELNYLFWECTTRCNLHCRHCGSDCAAPGSAPDMPLDDFLCAFDTIPREALPRPFTVVLTGGEPLLRPDIEEVVTCNLEIRETFKISKVGTIAGCMVLDGKITRNTKIRVIRDGIVIYTGMLGSLKRYKDDVKEVSAGMDCGLNIENFNDIKVGDIIEGYTEKEVARKL